MVPKMVAAKSSRYQEDDVTLVDVNCNVSICEGLVPFWSRARLGKWAIISPDLASRAVSHQGLETRGRPDTGVQGHSASVQSLVQSHQSLITPLLGAWGTKSRGNQCPAGSVHYPNRRIINTYDCLSPRMRNINHIFSSINNIDSAPGVSPPQCTVKCVCVRCPGLTNWLSRFLPEHKSERVGGNGHNNLQSLADNMSLLSSYWSVSLSSDWQNPIWHLKYRKTINNLSSSQN